MSGVCRGGPAKPSFAEHVADGEHARNEQWKQIVKAGANQRNCFLFINHQQYVNFLNTFAPK
jgi:hypothetical protein